MDFGPLRRRAIALAAAYAVALQALLSAFAPVALANPANPADPFAVLCSHDAAGGTGQPAQHDLPCAAICAAMGHGIAGAVPPDVFAAIAALYVVTAVVPLSNWISPPAVFTDTHAPRGPPLA